MVKLAIFIPDMRGGGAERVALELIKGFVGRGHEVDLVVMRAEGELMALVPGQANIIDLNVERIRASVRPLARYLKQRRPDALLALMWPLTAVAVVAKLIARSATRIAVSDHGLLSEQYAGRLGSLAALRVTIRLLYPRADVRIAPSRGIAADIGNLGGLKRESFKVIRNPVSVPPWPFEADEDADPSWGDATIRVLTVGALKPEKDHGLLLNAFAEFSRGREAQLTILGEGSLRPQLAALAGRLGIAERVHMPGFRTNPWPFYATAHLFVLSSQSEGFGNVLVEAMAAGIPIVSTDCAGPREILEGGKWGMLIPVHDRDAMSQAMEQAINRPIDRDALKSRAEQFRPEHVIDSYIAELLGSHPCRKAG